MIKSKNKDLLISLSKALASVYMCNILYLCVGKGYLQLDSPYYNVWFVWLFILLREYLHWACSGVWFVFVLCRLSPGRYTNGITLQWSSKFHYIHGPLSFFCLFLFQLGKMKKKKVTLVTIYVLCFYSSNKAKQHGRCFSFLEHVSFSMPICCIILSQVHIKIPR